MVPACDSGSALITLVIRESCLSTTKLPVKLILPPKKKSIGTHYANNNTLSILFLVLFNCLCDMGMLKHFIVIHLSHQQEIFIFHIIEM